MDFIIYLFKLIFWVIIAFSFLNALITHFIFWLELRLFALAKEQPLQIAWIQLLYNFVIEFLCIALNCFLYPFRFWFAKLNRAPTEGALPILFVHGYLHHQNAWGWFIYQLQKKTGVGSIYSINLSPPFASISQLAEVLQTKIELIKTETGANSVILIGHSMGGLVCGYYSEYLQKSKDIAKIITIGSPFKGTLTAALGFGQNAKEMSPHSHFLKELTESMQKSTIPYYSVLSKMDNMVVPWKSGLLHDDISKNDFVLENQGHLGLLISPLVIEQVYQWIKL